MTLGSSVYHLEIPTFCITEFSHAFQKLSDVCADWLSLQRRPRQKGHQRSSSGRLGQYCLWPRRRAAEQRDELAAPHHSITSSAVAHDPVGRPPHTQISIERIVGI